ncbi:MAG: hypothetical protein ACK4I8_10360, partial [Armatimonadota bacterium]
AEKIGAKKTAHQETHPPNDAEKKNEREKRNGASGDAPSESPKEVATELDRIAISRQSNYFGSWR